MHVVYQNSDLTALDDVHGEMAGRVVVLTCRCCFDVWSTCYFWVASWEPAGGPVGE